MLLYIIFGLTLLQKMLESVVKLLILGLKQLLLRTKSFEEYRSLQQELKTLTDQQKEINMLNEFAKYARIQRKVESLKTKMASLSNKMSKRYVLIRAGLYWTLRVLLGISFFYISVMYRHKPVLVVPSSLFPIAFLGKIVAFPTGVVGDVGCVFWIFLCQTMLWTFFRFIQ